MPYQPSLPEPSGADLLSPLFSPRPGWGGQLKVWLRRNVYSTIFRGVLLAAAVLIVLSLLRAPSESLVQEPLPTPRETAVVQVAAPGEGISQLTQRALDEWLAARNISLDAVQHLYAVDRMTHIAVTVANRPTAIIYTGEVVQFPHSLIQNTVAEAQELTPIQYAAWSQLLQ